MISSPWTELLLMISSPADRFGSVNRKALDQYTSFTEQREELGMRKAELDRSEAKIRELIQVGMDVV